MPDNEVEFHGITFTSDFIAPTSDRRAITRAPAAGLRHVTARHGFVARDFVTQVVFSSFLLALGLFAGANLFFDLGGFAPSPSVAFGLIFFGPIVGVWLFIDAFRRGWYIIVVADSRTWKFAFHGRVTAEEIDAALAELRRRFGWAVSRE